MKPGSLVRFIAERQETTIILLNKEGAEWIHGYTLEEKKKKNKNQCE